MKKTVSFLLICLLPFLPMAAQSVVSAIPASIAPANASTAYADRWAVFHNPAILVGEKKISATAGFENRFMLKELGTASLGVAVPTKYVQVGGAFSFYGISEAYYEIQAGIAVSRQFHEKFSMGVQFNYFSVYFSPTERNKGTVIAQIGFLSQVIKNLYLGFSAYNPLQTNIKSSTALNKRIPSVFSLGAMYRFTPKALWVAQVDKEIGNTVHWATGFEYQIVDELSLRLGGYGSPGPFVPTLGFGVNFWKIRIDANFEYHLRLGLNSIAKVSCEF